MPAILMFACTFHTTHSKYVCITDLLDGFIYNILYLNRRYTTIWCNVISLCN